MHKIFYIKKETLCALLLPTLHNPPVLFSAWREFSTLDRSWHQGCWDVQVPRAMSRVLKCGPRTRFSSQGPQRHWGQVKSSKIAAPLPLFLHTHTRARAHAHTLRRASWGRRVRASVEERCGGPVVTCAEWAEQRDAPSLSPQEDRLLFSTFLLTSDNLTVDICFSPFPTVNTTTGFIYAFIYIKMFCSGLSLSEMYYM